MAKQNKNSRWDRNIELENESRECVIVVFFVVFVAVVIVFVVVVFFGIVFDVAVFIVVDFFFVIVIQGCVIL